MKITFRVLLGVFTYFAKVLINIYTKFRLLRRHEYITDLGTLHFSYQVYLLFVWTSLLNKVYSKSNFLPCFSQHQRHLSF